MVVSTGAGVSMALHPLGAIFDFDFQDHVSNSILSELSLRKLIGIQLAQFLNMHPES